MPQYYTYLSADYTILVLYVGCLSKINISCNHFAEQDWFDTLSIQLPHIIQEENLVVTINSFTYQHVSCLESKNMDGY